MAKKKKSKKVNIKKIVLSQEDIVRTYNHVSKLRASESTLAWIENRMYELREKSTKAESAVCGCLRSWNITFIYQAPFILDGKIYFADFYIPDKKIVLEVDGSRTNQTIKFVTTKSVMIVSSSTECAPSEYQTASLLTKSY